MLSLLHRWTGGLIGLLLALLGLTGTLLLHEDAWLRWTQPHAADVQRQDSETLARATERLLAGPDQPRSLLFATRSFGLDRLSYAGERGAYATQDGAITERWNSVSERPETWLFDLHHHLLAGGTGETVTGLAGLAGLLFVVSGSVLWWRTRRTFAPRLLPKRFSPPAIVRHHRDLGIVAAPLLFLSMLTGMMMVLDPVANALLSPFSSPAAMGAATAPPPAEGGTLGPIDWRALIGTVRRFHPDAEIRVISLPARPGGLILVRARQPAEWLPNGRTLFWFDPATGRLVDRRDALAMPLGSRLFNNLYPVHAAKVGGLPYRLVMTLSGLALTLLGSLVTWSFWSRKGQRRRQPRRPRALQAR